MFICCIKTNVYFHVALPKKMNSRHSKICFEFISLLGWAQDRKVMNTGELSIIDMRVQLPPILPRYWRTFLKSYHWIRFNSFKHISFFIFSKQTELHLDPLRLFEFIFKTVFHFSPICWLEFLRLGNECWFVRYSKKKREKFFTKIKWFY